MSQDQQLLDLVKTLSGRLAASEMEIKSLKLVNAADIPEDILAVLAAAVAAYLGFQGEKKQRRFASLPMWAKGTRNAQLNHIPVR